MNSKRLYISLLVVLLSIMLVVVLCIERSSRSYDERMPSDFNFIAKISSNLYIVDTYSGTLTKTLDWDLDTIIQFELSEREKEVIYETLVDIDICKYPENYAPTSIIKVSPRFSYYFEFTMDDLRYKINWQVNTESETEDSRDLIKLFLLIENCINGHDKIKNLPESQRVYL